MGIVSKFDIRSGRSQPPHAQAVQTGENTNRSVITDSQTMGKEINNAPVDSEAGRKDIDALPDPDAQRGVQKIEAVTSAWSKWALAALLFKYVFSISPLL
jgi:hypothetical protein